MPPNTTNGIHFTNIDGALVGMDQQDWVIYDSNSYSLNDFMNKAEDFLSKNKDNVPFGDENFLFDIHDYYIIGDDTDGKDTLYYIIKKSDVNRNNEEEIEKSFAKIVKGYLFLDVSSFSTIISSVLFIEADRFVGNSLFYLSEKAGAFCYYGHNCPPFYTTIDPDDHISCYMITYRGSSTRDYFSKGMLRSKECWQILLLKLDILKRSVERAMRGEISARQPLVSTTRFLSKTSGDYITHKVPFAIEIESYGKDEQKTAEMSIKIDREWGLCRDGSLTSSIGFPVEIQSPILSGKLGEENIIKTCDILNSLGFAVDKTCGLHVHFSGDGTIVPKDKKQTVPNLISLYAFHRLFEDVIVSFLPTTRRRNRYCATYKNGVEYEGNTLKYKELVEEMDKLDRVRNKLDFEKFWYQTEKESEINYIKNRRYTIYRYMGINFHSLLKSGHIEVRYHSGTLNYEKILHWIELHGKIIEKCVAGVINMKYIRSLLSKKMTLEEKTKELFSIIGLKNESVDYFLSRQHSFIDADSKDIDEIIISKTKKLEII